MSYDVNDLCRRLDDLGVPYTELDSGHLVRWKTNGLVCEYACRIYGGRASRLTVHGLTPAAVIDALLGPGCAECKVGGAE